MTLEVVTVLRPPRPTAALPLTLSESQVAALPPLDAALMYTPHPEQFVKWFPYHMVVDSRGGIIQVGGVLGL